MKKKREKRTKNILVFAAILLVIVSVGAITVFKSRHTEKGVLISNVNFDEQDKQIELTIINMNNTKTNCTLTTTLLTESSSITRTQESVLISAWAKKEVKIDAELPEGATNITIKPECKNE